MSEFERMELWRDARLALHRHMLRPRAGVTASAAGRINHTIRQNVAESARRIALLRQRAAQA